MPKETALTVIGRRIFSLFGGGERMTREYSVRPITVFNRGQHTYLPSEQGFQAISPRALEALMPQVIEQGGRIIQRGAQRSFEAMVGPGGGKIGDLISLSGGSMMRGHEATFEIIVEGREK